MPRASSRKFGDCERLRRRHKRAGAKPKPTPNAVEPGSASIRREAQSKRYIVTTVHDPTSPHSHSQTTRKPRSLQEKVGTFEPRTVVLRLSKRDFQLPPR